MATTNSIYIPTEIQMSQMQRSIQSRSISGTSSTGANSSSGAAVPAGKFWRLQYVRLAITAANTETWTNLRLTVADQDGTAYAALPWVSSRDVDNLATPNAMMNVDLAAVGWSGDVVMPPGWKVIAQWNSSVNTSTYNWQWTAIEYG